MPQHEVTQCALCNSRFECKMGTITQCQCFEVEVSRQTRQFLEQTDLDCLCKNCLSLLNQKIENLKGEKFPKASELRENFHYYMENGFWVFTENYHLLRGYCCQSGCRHCAYGFKKE